MISSKIAEQLTNSLKHLRAVTEPTQDLDSVNYHSCYNSGLTEKQITAVNVAGQMQFDFGSTCYAKHNSSDIAQDKLKKFLQDIAQEAKEWTDQPSDCKKIGVAIDYVLQLAEGSQNGMVGSSPADRLKHEDMLKIVRNIVKHTTK
jgi:hypothetical protein